MKAAIVAFFSILLVFSLGCIQKEQPLVQEPPIIPPGNNQTAPSDQPCSAGNVVQKDECFFNLAKGPAGIVACKSIYSIGKTDECYSLFASGDLEACKSISDADMRAGCLSQNALRVKDQEICNLIDNAASRAECLKQVVPPCTIGLSQEERELCLALEKNDYTLCLSDECLRAFAEEKKVSEACIPIKGEADRFACVAIVRANPSECKQSSLASVQDLCLQKASIALGDLASCSLATPGSTYRNDCYTSFAISQKDDSICKKSTPEDSRDLCYASFSLETANTTACAKISSSINRVGCYYFASAKNRMPSLCNPLQNEAQRNDCYGKGMFIPEGPLAADCMQVSSQEWKDKCLRIAATKAYDRTLCEPIITDYEKKACEDLFAS